ncbi:DNA alkylation repair protein [Lacihabitans sp. LS3-19]|uniref:DNA alkylation repair protein n=1 Tax=Lacihabitans sp. LS3-19 TaxID=2487335 RepID=UPI0020CE181C|nr:DNA alkylation repair protein [Lacihabitans sp. LS3-19]MCP9770699.1 DNA alkylation repair protein [Lacihabitans sp. LS3-19]
MYETILKDILFLGNPDKAQSKAKYFKNGKGEYGEGDVFVGLTNPETHQISKHYKNLATFDDLQKLIENQIHEVRFVALTILVLQIKKAKTENEIERFVEFYFKNLKYVNNWDLVDCSCMHILGPYFYEKTDKSKLYKLAKSGDLWSERISIITTFYFIRKGNFTDTFKISDILIHHKHDLIHKATGWMLREVWQKGGKEKVEFYIRENIKIMPRTMLRYAIEKMEEMERKSFLNLGK